MKAFLEKIKLWQSTPNWMEYMLFACLTMAFLLSYNYSDFQTLTLCSTYILDALVDGRIDEYYTVVYENIYGSGHLCLGFNYLTLIPWAIWNIPIWLVQRFDKMRILDHTWMLLWSKMFLVSLTAVMAVYSRKIIKLFTKDSYICKWSNYLIICCPFVFFGVTMAGQSDIIVIAAAVIAVYYLLQDRKGLFLLWMAYSISAKPFLIFAYVAVVLLIEKNVIKIAGMLLCSLAPAFLFNLLYNNMPMYQESLEMGTTDSIVNKTLMSTFSAMGEYQASIVIVLLVFLYFAAYCINYDKSIDKKRYVIYMMLAPMMVYLAFSSYEHYRKLYLIPFMVIMMAVNRPFWTVNVLLEKVLTVLGVFLPLYSVNPLNIHFVSPAIMGRLGLARDIVENSFVSVGEFMCAMMGDNQLIVQILTLSVYMAVSMLFLILNLPILNRRLPVPKVSCVRAVYWVDILTTAAMVVSLFAVYLIR